MTADDRSCDALPLPSPVAQSRQAFDVVFVLPHLGPGGAQKVVSQVANAWAGGGMRVCVITLLDNKPDSHPLLPEVRRVRVGDLDAIAGGDRSVLYEDDDDEEEEEDEDEEEELFDHDSEISVAPQDSPGIAQGFRHGVRIRARAVVAKVAGEEGVTLVRVSVLRPIRRLIRASVRAPGTLAIAANDAMSGRKWLDGIHSRLSRTIINALRHKLDRQRAQRRLRACLKATRSPVVMSLLTKTNIRTLAAARGLGCRVIVSERNDPDRQHLEEPWATLRSHFYSQAAQVTANSEGIVAKLSKFAPAERTAILPNPVMLPRRPLDFNGRQNRIVTVARLVEQKGLDVLIEAWKQAHVRLSDWHLDIVGDGPLAATLAEQAKAYGVADKVTFHGHVADPTVFLFRGRIFVLPSRFEGMPNALLEAMNCGLAPIVTDASPGPLEFVTHDETGLVVSSDDADALAAAILALGTDDEWIARLASAAHDRMEALSWERVEPQWRQVLGLQEGVSRPAPVG